ncbi:sugar ABC transporter permease [Kordiimonas sp. SCSIO 12603]|uniref:carbohydrate ABC transporter permease n=1 Tax=Kordiimonas sp. SCSIO 12603 TaxID=2829596 RepID=UPI0021036F08|nr:sugar ABC transporter permease [Kordiimonas sp. SCSIO 12603]UTW59516.1 sugar ABC transporter permease [Kordiimonas sp. SCSIO 12603]
MSKLSSLFERNFLGLTLGPIMLLLICLVVVPFLVLIGISLTDLNFNIPDRDGSFVGLQHFHTALFKDDRFLNSLYVQAIFLITTIPFELLFGLLGAFVLIHCGKYSKALLPVVAIPIVLAPVTVGMLWRLLLHGDYGPIGFYLRELGIVNGTILGDPSFAFVGIVLADIWQWTPLFIIILFTALKSIPERPIRAAKLDGANGIQLFWSIQMPLIKPAVLLAVLIRVMDSFKEFDKAFQMTHGGPASSTELINIYTWIVSFQHGDIGYGSAITVIIYILIYCICLALFKTFRKDWRTQ